ncbi:MAG TPA: MOSC domain-containing protein [Streptosporangiaceae bacterium]|nr:MOSC domain-containing protein [Streptosporangiaceae bacterium]
MKYTAIDKRPVTGQVRVGLLGLDGDEQADLDDHGGPEQAVYAYAREDLDWWEGQLGRELRDGVFGENVTIEGLEVTGALIGETWRLGSAVVQVTSPRIPCSVFRGWMDEKGWVKRFAAAARPGAYLRVLRPGTVGAGSEAERLSRPERSVTVRAVLRGYYDRDAEVIAAMVAVPGHNRRFDTFPSILSAAEAGAIGVSSASHASRG